MIFNNNAEAMEQALDAGDVFSVRNMGKTYYGYRRVTAGMETGKSKITTLGKGDKRAITYDQYDALDEQWAAIDWDFTPTNAEQKMISEMGKIPEKLETLFLEAMRHLK